MGFGCRSAMVSDIKEQIDLVDDNLENWEIVMSSFVESALDAKAGIKDAWVGLGEDMIGVFADMVNENAEANIKMHKDNANAEPSKLDVAQHTMLNL